MMSKGFIPIIKIDDDNTCRPWQYIPCSSIVVKLFDLMSGMKSFSQVYNKIRDAGGIHEYLNCNCDVILSFIMPDEFIRKCNIEVYIRTISDLKPDFFTTPDGETYEHEDKLALKEIERTLDYTRELIDKCHSIPIGLIKGSNLSQISYHVDRMREMNIDSMVFHTGDFLYKASDYDRAKARHYASSIRSKCNNLSLYGIGPGDFTRFGFADNFMSQSYYVSAFNGKVFNGYKWRFSKLSVEDRIIENLISIEAYFKHNENINCDVRSWAVEHEAVADQAAMLVTRRAEPAQTSH